MLNSLQLTNEIIKTTEDGDPQKTPDAVSEINKVRFLLVTMGLVKV